jgi:hypothetical protein
VDGSYLTYIYKDQYHHRGERMLVRVITYSFTDSRIEGGRKTGLPPSNDLVGPFLVPGQRISGIVS